MINPALLLIEEAYDIAMNPTADYWAQLQPLAPNGELANRLTSNQVLFRLCMVIDKQEREIASLKDDRVSIAKQLLELKESKNPTVVDPTLPLG